MAITEQLRTVARLEYLLVRSALSTVDRAILTPLADRSPGVDRVVSRARDAFVELDDRLDDHFRGTGQSATPPPAREAAHDAVDKLSDALEKPVEKVEKSVGEAADKIEESVDEAADKAEESIDKAKNKAADKAADKAEDAVEDVADSAGNTSEPASDEGSAVLTEPEVHEAEELAEEFLETEADHVTGELAENEDLREVQARLRAKHTLQEQDEQHR